MTDLRVLTEGDQPTRPTRTTFGTRFKFHLLDHLPEPPVRHEIIAGLVAAGEVFAMIGAPAGGKSSLAVLLAACMASGRPFLGRDVEPGVVIYIAAERARETERRLLAVAGPGLPIVVSGCRPALGDSDDIDELIRTIVEIAAAFDIPVRLIVIDTAARCFRGLNENSTADMGIATDALTRIGEVAPTAALGLLHHLTKDGTSSRGSGALPAAVDLELTVRGREYVRSLVVTMANAVAEDQTLTFRLDPIPAGDGGSVIAASAAEVPTGCEDGPKPVRRLSPDAKIALAALQAMPEGSVSLDDWRAATFDAFGQRTRNAKRVAWVRRSQHWSHSPP